MATLVVICRAVIRFFREADIFLLVLSLSSAIYGIVLINSVVRNAVPATNEVYVQVGALVIGVILFVLFSYIDIDIIADKSRFLFAFSLLLITTLLVWGAGEAEVGERSWLRFFGVGIQPAEVTKIPFIIIVARMITTFKERKTLNSILSVFQIVVVFIVFLGIIFLIPRDLGTAIVYFGIFVIMLFTGGLKLRWFAIGTAVVTALTPIIWENIITERQRNRILAPFMPDVIDPDRTRVLWQPDRSVEAIATGGFRGQGLGNGRLSQTAGAIPAQHTDFVFSIAGEELGFVGCMLIIALLVTIIIRCVYIGIKSNNPLGMLVCMGVAGLVIVQTIMNIGMALGILPVIGITLPFFSYGGSSIVTCFAAMGIVSGIKMRPKPIRFRTL